MLKPKFEHGGGVKNNSCVNTAKIGNNVSKITIQSRKTLVNAYTFKRHFYHKDRKHDPVSLYARVSQLWEKNKFLRNNADAKEGRKLELDKRNKIGRML
jgi:hypothetical protein